MSWNDFENSQFLEIFAGYWKPLEPLKAAAYLRGLDDLAFGDVATALETIHATSTYRPTIDAIRENVAALKRSSGEESDTCQWCLGSRCLPVLVYVVPNRAFLRLKPPEGFTREIAGDRSIVHPDLAREMVPPPEEADRSWWPRRLTLWCDECEPKQVFRIRHFTTRYAGLYAHVEASARDEEVVARLRFVDSVPPWPERMTYTEFLEGVERGEFQVSEEALRYIKRAFGSIREAS